MAILNENIKLMAAERLTDEDDGGGRMTGNEVADGEVNNLFPDISRLDRVYGRVNLRKAFLFVDTANVDTYYGAHAVIEDAPDDPNVGVVLFSTDSHVDERGNARNRIESYVTQGPESDLRPLGDQLTGQRSITLYQRPGARPPEINEVYVLSIEDSGREDNGTYQYVRIQDVASELQTFTYATNNGYVDFEVQVVTCDLTNELRYDFPGRAPTRDFASAATKVRSTQIANAARYYGISKLVEPVAPGDLALQVESVYHPIVPVTQSETPQVDIAAGAQVTHEETSGTETLEVSDVAHTDHVLVTIQNRGLAWTHNLRPLPAPGTLTIEYRALGKWYRLSDRGDGKLEGDGAGTLTYATGSVAVTLAALPDADTPILYTWGTTQHYTDRSGDAAEVTLPEVLITPSGDMAPGSLVVQWEDAEGALREASDDGQGALTGDATGEVVYSGAYRQVRLTPNSLPASTAQYQLTYQRATAQRETFEVADSNGTVSVTLPGAPLEPGSITLRVPMLREGEPVFVTLADDGRGGLRFAGGGAVAASNVDYATGAVQFDCRREYRRHDYQRTGFF